MCIIVYKADNEQFPKKKVLKTCFTNNPDGAGFMYAYNHKVHIEKGFMSFSAFWKKLTEVRKKVGDNLPYVLHFRISTQAGKRQDCTHPFPLSKNMEDLRKLSSECDIGVAHNGIITLTSYGYTSYVKQITYNDTMEFITDYLSLIIKDKNYYEDLDTIQLIRKLCESRLAILDGDGHIQFIGSGWIIENGIVYSNDSYKETVWKQVKIDDIKKGDEDEEKAYYCSDYIGETKYNNSPNMCLHCDMYDCCFGLAMLKEDEDEYEDEYIDEDEIFDFEPSSCPAREENYSYCYGCKSYEKCCRG